MFRSPIALPSPEGLQAAADAADATGAPGAFEQILAGVGAFFSDLAWIDTVGLILVGVLLLLGFARGLWWQVIRLVGLVGAVVLARALSPRFEPRLLEAFPELPPRLAQGLVWLLIFLAGLAAATLLGLLGKKMLEALQLSLLDRTGGALVGAVTGLLIHSALLAALVQLGPEQWVVATVEDTYSEGLLEVVGHQFPLVVNAAEGSEIDGLLQWRAKAEAGASSDG